MRKDSAMGRFSITAIMLLALPAFAAAQHRGGGIAFAPASRAAPTISRATPAGAHATGRTLSGPQSTARIGTPVLHARNGARIIHRNNSTNFAFNGTDLQDVPGLGFDYPHLAAISGNRRMHGNRFLGGVPFGFGGFLLGPSVIQEDGPVVESQPGDAQSSATEEQAVAEDAPPVQRSPRRARSPRRMEPEADSAPTPPRDDEQYVFVRRDGSLVFAVAYAWESGTLRYITPDGLRRSIGRDALDIDATQQFNEQRGLNFRAPA
jgi:hypothetical protein